MVKNNVMRKPKHMQHSGKKAFVYKNLTEKDISETINIPNEISNDFVPHIARTKVNATEY